MSATSPDKLQSVFRNGLCTRCGTCVGLSGGAIRFADRDGKCLPEFVETVDAALADRLWQGCSGQEVSFPDLNRFVFGEDAAPHAYLGHTRRVGVAYADDPEVRRESASGGVLTSVLLWLLEQGEVDGAVVTRMSETEPWRPETFIARTGEEIRSAAQSKYVITSVNEILPEVESFGGDLAYVGLPCQVHSIRKLQQAGDPSVRAIKYVLGPFCGNTLHLVSVRTLLRAHGHRDHTRITRLSFREGEWPGNMRIDLKGGESICLPKFHANYLIPFSIMKRCLLCTDLTNEFTDISGGDAWAPVYEERGKGFSMAIARTAEGERILDAMKEAGRLSIEPLAIPAAVGMHSHGYDLKKRGAFIRIRFRRLFGRAVPAYGVRPGRLSPLRWMMEVVIDMLFALFGTRMARSLVATINPAWMGRLFEHARTHWKGLTRNVKRDGLHG